MPSNAWRSFGQQIKDIKRLLQFHTEHGGDEKGRRFGLEVLNKSAIVLITAYWEAYCEDIAAEGLRHIVEKADVADKLPIEIKKQIAKELKSDLHDIAIWGIADDGWRDVLRARLTRLQQERDRRLNTPKTKQIDELFLTSVGLASISTCWKWRAMSAAGARTKLDKYVELRGAIAHRGSAAGSVTKAQVVDYFSFIKRVVSKTGGRVFRHVKQITGEAMW